MKNIIIKYPKQFKIINGGKEFHKLMKDAFKQQVMDRMHRPKGKEAQRESDPITE